MAALPACSDLAPSSCAPCLFRAQNTYLEFPYHVVPVTVDLVPYVWQLSNGANTTYISRITQTPSGSPAIETGLIYSEGETPVWTVDGVVLTSGTTYAQFTNFVGAAPTAGCANGAAESEIELPASADSASLIYAIPAANVQAVPAATETAVLDYLGSLQTVVAQLGGNQPLSCPASVTATAQPTACISSSLSTSVTCYDYLYGETKCVTTSQVVKRTVDLVERQEDISSPSVPPVTKTTQTNVGGITPASPTGSPSTPTFASTTSSSTESSSASPSSSTSPVSSSTTPSSSESSATPSSTSSTTTIPTSTSSTTTTPTSTSSTNTTPSSSAVETSTTTASSSPPPPSTTLITTTVTETVKGTPTVIVSTVTAAVPSSASTSAQPPPISKTGENSIPSIVPVTNPTTVYQSPPTITSSSSTAASGGGGTVESEILPSTTTPAGVGGASGSATEGGSAGASASASASATAGGSSGSGGSSGGTGSSSGSSGGSGTGGNGSNGGAQPLDTTVTTTIITGSPATVHMETTTTTYYVGPSSRTSVGVTVYDGAAQKAAVPVVPVGGMLGFIALLVGL